MGPRNGGQLTAAFSAAGGREERRRRRRAWRPRSRCSKEGPTTSEGSHEKSPGSRRGSKNSSPCPKGNSSCSNQIGGSQKLGVRRT